jgi:NAD(P)-dependent dehydrogenase (short-subunit alcohol dehydrogenase family)
MSTDAGKKLAWITGASTGIGAATAIALAQEGWDVVATARSQDKLEQLAKLSHEFKGRLLPMPGDVTDKQAMAALVAEVEERLGPIELAMLNAGNYIPEELATFNSDEFISQVQLNLFGAVLCLEPLLPRLLKRGRGHIALVASVAGYRGLPRSLGYGSSKAAMIHLAEALAVMGAPKGLKVQVINPGFVKTPLTDKNDFKMPFLIDTGEAARAIMAGLKSDRFEIFFPKRFGYILKTLGLLPDKLYFAAVRSTIPKEDPAK